MFSLVFLVCSPLSGSCYTATSTVVYPTEEVCKTDALDIIERNMALQKEGKMPPEQAIFKCIAWGTPS